MGRFTADVCHLLRKRHLGPGMWGSMFVRVFGVIGIVDNASGETVCEIEVK